MPMYDLLEYSDKCSMTSRVLQNYHRDETNDDAKENENDYRVNKKKATTSKPFE